MKLLKKLINIPSISGMERTIQEFIFTYLSTHGIDPVWVKGNILCKVDGKDNTKALIFNAHVDTVNMENKKEWKNDPFLGKQIKGKMFGLGASDEKSGVAAVLLLLEELIKVPPVCDVWCMFVIKEETDGSGTQDSLSWFIKKQKKNYTELAVILTEPTCLSSIEVAHKGNLFLRVITKGEGGHSSKPYKIKNHAIHQMYKIENILSQLSLDWQKTYQDALLGSPTISSFTSISGGNVTTPNKIPNICTATFDIRTIPVMHDRAFSIISHALQAFSNSTIDTVYKPLSCGYTEKTAKIVRVAQKVTGLPLSVTSGSTDLLFFTQQNIPGIILGPGEKNCEHQTNEFVEVKKIYEAIKIYKDIIQTFVV